VGVITASLLLGSPNAFASDECVDKTCVDVFTQDNQLIITAQKNGNKPTAKPKVIKPTAKPVAKPSIKSTLKPTLKPKPIKKIAAPKPKIASASLSDRLIKLLPVGDINFQPEKDALVNMPVYFWTQTPQRFNAVVPILDLIVYVNLYATFVWSYGDGTFMTTTNQGAAFPLGAIKHTYKNNNQYQVGLKVIWRGSWSVNGVTTPISGDGLTQSITRGLSVVDAVGRFTK
jgi:hypothetical protein